MANNGKWLTRLTAAGLVVAMAGCEGEPTGFSDPVSVRRFFASMYAVMPVAQGGAATSKLHLSRAAAATAPVIVNAVLRSGVIPRANDGPTGTIVLESSVITGTPGKIRVLGDAPFTRVAVTVPGTVDYWEITLPSPVLDLQVIATGSSSLPNATFTMDAAVGVGSGFGGSSQTIINAVDLASSDIAVIVRWNALADVDLHVTDPKGVEVYFGRTSSPEGGRLDLDSNPACNFDGVNQEVITWPVGQAPPGEYKVSVFYWSDCGAPRTDYAVTLMSRGRTLQVLEGAFTGSGSPSTGVDIGRVTYP
ncbi:MAG: YfaP family protein [Gemmatimonadales bacterium]